MTRIGKNLIITLIILLALILVFVSMFTEVLFRMALKPDVGFEVSERIQNPDYTNTQNWAAFPGQESGATLTPDDTKPASAEQIKADVFYIHPTSYFGTDSWNDPMNDEKSIAMVDYMILPNQASIFNGCCRIFAPRYRQATLYSFMGDESEGAQALYLAYSDVLRAFDYYVSNLNEGRPIVLASHSQGTHHLIRLIEDRISGHSILDQIVAIYGIGYRFPLDKISGWSDLDLCDGPTETGCILAWDTFRERSAADSDPGRGVYYSGEYRSAIGKEVACVNPVTWRADGERANADDHLGIAILPSNTGVRQLFEAVEKTEEFKIFDKKLTPRCKDGFLRIMETGQEDLDKTLFPNGSYHLLDYNLFYFNMRENVSERIAAFLKQ